jgi:hypothetical protein
VSDRDQVDLTTIVCVTENEVSTRVGEEAVILDLDNAVYYGLDPVGARIFELLVRPTPLHDVLSSVLAEFEVDEDTARTDLLALVGDLLEKRLVVVTSGDAP